MHVFDLFSELLEHDPIFSKNQQEYFIVPR